ncbi:MAG TPA: cytochrome c [Gemmatimonadales bacterium]|nr:cytochrome c [Gemmatimonadales bacterium]
MRFALKAVGVLLLVLLLAAGGVYLWASAATGRKLARTVSSHTASFSIPMPLPADEIGRLGLDEAGARRVAGERAVERGRHLIEARYACGECHGKDFGGGTMVDDAMLGRLLGPNLTTGAGSRTAAFEASDWDRIVRHGIRRDGHPAMMPSVDFQLMSDQELSDIVAYIRSLPPRDNEVPRVRLGPLGKVLVATGKLPLSADLIPQDRPHAAVPPAAEVSAEFGRHLAGVCTGCHGEDLAGGPIVGGDPSWPPARNLTPHPNGLAGWAYGQFVTALKDSRRPDGDSLRVPMTFIAPYARRMTDTELQALWAYVRSVPPRPGSPPSR